MNKAEQAARGSRMTQLMGDPIMKEAFDRTEEQFYEAWKNSEPDQQEQREQAYLALIALQRLKDNMISVISTGQLARAEIKAAEARQEKENAE